MDEGDGAKRTGGSFLDSLGRLFGGKTEPAAAPAAAPPASGFEALEAAVRALNERIEQQRGPAAATGTAAGSGPSTPAERKADRERHIESVRREMREDIERMHTRLGTGLTATDLDAIAALLEELEAMAVEGRGSAALLPRARAAIVERLRSEAGELAVARVAALLREQGMEWPDPSRPPPSATHEEIARARRRRLEDVRRAFLGEGFARSGESLRGIVKGWGADYPDRGSPLWEACVLEGVAAGLRGQLLQRFVELLRRDRDELLREAEAAVGKETAALQQALGGGVRSLEEAHRAAQSAMRVLDEVMPALAWERIRARLPEARGESA